MIRVLVVDDHLVVRDGLELLVGRFDGIECVGTAADGAEAMAQASALAPDVVLMDLSMPGMDGVEATRQMTATGGGPAVLVLTTFADRRHVIDAVDAGAVGYLLKDTGPISWRPGSGPPPAASPPSTRRWPGLWSRLDGSAGPTWP